MSKLIKLRKNALVSLGIVKSAIQDVSPARQELANEVESILGAGMYPIIVSKPFSNPEGAGFEYLTFIENIEEELRHQGVEKPLVENSEKIYGLIPLINRIIDMLRPEPMPEPASSERQGFSGRRSAPESSEDGSSEEWSYYAAIRPGNKSIADWWITNMEELKISFLSLSVHENPLSYSAWNQWMSDNNISKELEPDSIIAEMERVFGEALPTELEAGSAGDTSAGDTSAGDSMPRMEFSGSDRELKIFMRSISTQESGGDYNIENEHSDAHGKYQIMPKNWPSWSKQCGLPRGSERTPENQEAVAKCKMKKYFDRYNDWWLVAVAWYSGHGGVIRMKKLRESGELDRARTTITYKGKGKYPGIASYADKIMKRFYKNMGIEEPEALVAQAGRASRMSSLFKLSSNKPRGLGDEDMYKNVDTISDFGRLDKSEDQKKLDTMMADMGIQSLDDLSREERSRFIKAVLGESKKKEKRRERGVESSRKRRQRVTSPFRTNLDYMERESRLKENE